MHSKQGMSKFDQGLFGLAVIVFSLISLIWSTEAIYRYTPGLVIEDIDLRSAIALGTALSIDVAVFLMFRWWMDSTPDNVLQKITMILGMTSSAVAMIAFRIIESAHAGQVPVPEWENQMIYYVGVLPVVGMFTIMAIPMLGKVDVSLNWLAALMEKQYTANSQMPGRQQQRGVRPAQAQEHEPMARPKSRQDDGGDARSHGSQRPSQQVDARRRAFDPSAGLATGAYQQVGDIPPIPGTRIPVEEYETQ